MHTTHHNLEPDQSEKGPRILLSVEAAAEQLSYSRTRVYALLKTGEIESVKVGRLRRIPADALAAYVNRLTTEQRYAA
jgi:excisionase family DNA binding protein